MNAYFLSSRSVMRTILVLIAVLSVAALLLYYAVFRTTERVFTRDNTNLERLPEGMDIPMMPGGTRVDYVRAYEAIFPRFTERPEENGLRDVVRYMGMGIFRIARDCTVEGLSPEEAKKKRDDSLKAKAKEWRALCQSLALDPADIAELRIFESISSPRKKIYERKFRQWKTGNLSDSAEMPEDNPKKYPQPTIPDGPGDPVENARDFLESHYFQKFRENWDADEFPEMAQWLHRQDEMLDVVARAAEKERFFIPYYRPYDDAMLITVIDECSSFLVDASEGLLCRASMNAAAGNAEKALADVTALWRLAGHLRQMPSLVVQLNGMRIGYGAKDVTLAILKKNLCTAEQLKTLLAVIDSRPALPAVSDVLMVDNWGMQEFIDTGDKETVVFHPEFWDSSIAKPVWKTTIDPNILADHYTALRKQWETLYKVGDMEKVRNFSDGLSSQRADPDCPPVCIGERSRAMAGLFFEVVAPAWQQYAMGMVTRWERHILLTRLAIALRVYKTEHGLYPETPDGLVPAYLPVIPQVPEPELHPLRYARCGEGYVLSLAEKTYDLKQYGRRPETGEEEINAMLVVAMEE